MPNFCKLSQRFNMNQMIVSISIFYQVQKSCPQFCIDGVAGKQILGIPLPSIGMLNESTLLERDKYLILCIHNCVENTVMILGSFIQTNIIL